MTRRLVPALVGGAFALGVLFGAVAAAGIRDVAAAPVVEASLSGTERPMADHSCPMDAEMAAMGQMHAGMGQMHAGMPHGEGRSPDDRERGRSGMTHGEGMTSGDHDSHHSPEVEADR